MSSTNEKLVMDFIENTKFPSSDETVRIKHLWDDRYRVNIWNDGPPSRITSSYFIKVTPSGVQDASISS